MAQRMTGVNPVSKESASTVGMIFFDNLPTSDTAASGTLKIWGATESIADITSAAGWEILGCKKDSLSQVIRLVCSGSDSYCSRLYDTIGAVGNVSRYTIPD
ncbi:hypothetical protein DFP72DRAFT_1080801 [Ephemerocybe angulata]|uniref:Uncharacterized protein n=1 Tax=Ephemerocybe angulata TaxID=980116 RepID=A0A8H6H9W7_9AGAR|nr:hypothetical protein DFP72DRAFT_1080801 [Tulosesus angulatus]